MLSHLETSPIERSLTATCLLNYKIDRSNWENRIPSTKTSDSAGKLASTWWLANLQGWNQVENIGVELILWAGRGGGVVEICSFHFSAQRLHDRYRSSFTCYEWWNSRKCEKTEMSDFIFLIDTPKAKLQVTNKSTHITL